MNVMSMEVLTREHELSAPGRVLPVFDVNALVSELAVKYPKQQEPAQAAAPIVPPSKEVQQAEAQNLPVFDVNALVSELAVKYPKQQELRAGVARLEISSSAESDTERSPTRRHTLYQKLGAGLLAFSAVTGYFSFGPAEDKPQSQVASEVMMTNTTEATEAESIDIVSSAAETIPAADSAEAIKLYRPQPGDYMGRVIAPTICLDASLYSFSEQEVYDEMVGTGEAVLDKKIPALNPTVEDCEQVLEHEQEIESNGGNFIKRSERVGANGKASAIGPGNPEGAADYWEPIVGHQASIVPNHYLSELPGEEVGHSVIEAHGSTYSAAAANIAAMRKGDPLIIDRADGKLTTYEVIEHRVVDEDSFDEIFYEYSHPDYRATIVLYLCSDKYGNTGSGTNRLAVFAGLPK